MTLLLAVLLYAGPVAAVLILLVEVAHSRRARPLPVAEARLERRR